MLDVTRAGWRLGCFIRCALSQLSPILCVTLDLEILGRWFSAVDVSRCVVSVAKSTGFSTQLCGNMRSDTELKFVRYDVKTCYYSDRAGRLIPPAYSI